MAKFKIFTDSCSDLGTIVRKKYDIDYVHMGLVVDGVEKRADLDWVDYSPEEFYGWLKAGKKVKTTQVSVTEFLDCFRPALKEGYDILYLGCSSALSGSVNTCEVLVIPQLKEEFPDRKVIAIDTLLASGVEGMITVRAAELRAEGKSLEEVAAWCEENKKYFNQFATVDTLNYLKAAGRIKGAKAFFGNLFHKRPVFLSDRHGANTVIKTVTGSKNSYNELINLAKENIANSEDKRVFVGHGDDMDTALMLKDRLLKETEAKEVIMSIVGPITGVTCGPGVVVVGTFGEETPEIK